jgi:hypothetical protein
VDSAYGSLSRPAADQQLLRRVSQPLTSERQFDKNRDRPASLEDWGVIVDLPSWEHFGTHGQSAYPELWEGVRVYYAPCLGPTGTRLADLGGSSNLGTLTSMDAATDWVVDDGRYALDFDGVNDRIDIPIGGAIGLADFSFFGWVKVRGASVNSVLWDDRLTGKSLIYFPNATTVYFRGDNFGGLAFTVPSLLNRWVQIAITRRNNSVRCYLNGVESTTGALTDSDPVIFNEIGRSAVSGFNINSLIDDQYFLNMASTATEIKMRYEIGRGGMLTPAPTPALFAFPSNPLAIFAASHAAVVGG